MDSRRHLIYASVWRGQPCLTGWIIHNHNRPSSCVSCIHPHFYVAIRHVQRPVVRGSPFTSLRSYHQKPAGRTGALQEHAGRHLMRGRGFLDPWKRAMRARPRAGQYLAARDPVLGAVFAGQNLSSGFRFFASNSGCQTPNQALSVFVQPTSRNSFSGTTFFNSCSHANVLEVGFVCPIQTHRQLGLVVRCGDLAL